MSKKQILEIYEFSVSLARKRWSLDEGRMLHLFPKDPFLKWIPKSDVGDTPDILNVGGGGECWRHPQNLAPGPIRTKLVQNATKHMKSYRSVNSRHMWRELIAEIIKRFGEICFPVCQCDHCQTNLAKRVTSLVPRRCTIARSLGPPPTARV